MNRNKGFSLVELIIVIAIMAILAAALAPALLRYIHKAQKTYDLDTGSAIGKNTQLILAEGESNSNSSTPGGTITHPYESFYADNTVTATCTTGGASYTLVIVCDTQDNGKGNHSLEIHPANSDAQAFASALNTQLGSDFKVRNKNPDNTGTDMTTYIVGYSSTNINEIEVWIGPDGTTPTYMLFPTPDPIYQD